MDSCEPLSNFLCGDCFDPERPIAFYKNEWQTGRQLLDDVNRWRALFGECSEIRWAVHLKDSYEFLVVLLALLHSGKTIVLLPNAQPDFLAAIDGEMDAVLNDEQVEGLARKQLQYAHCSSGITALISTLVPLDADDATIELFTSGSTGTPKKIVKRLFQLEREVDCLEATWGKQTAGATVVSTISHQHIYGLLFRLLWPLCTSRPFISEQFHFPEKIVEQVKYQQRAVLVSSPAHLTRMPDIVDLSELSPQLLSIYSSGGPLSQAAACRIKAETSIDVCEIFGSSETGGVAYRTQSETETEQLWTPFDSVDVASCGEPPCLQVRSPYLDNNDWYLMSDIVQLHKDGKFLLRGRADKIVKIEEKRLSLTEMEQRLCSSPLVDECALVVLMGRRSVVAAVVVLSKEGRQQLENTDEKEIKSQLKTQLAGYFESVLLPRKWRLVSTLPVNSQGKQKQHELKALFDKRKQSVENPLHIGSSQPIKNHLPIKMPYVRHSTVEDNQLELELYIPSELYYFSGHFPDKPVLPGVVQIDWVMTYAKEFLAVLGEFQGMEAIKFRDIIEPETTLHLLIHYRKDKHKLVFRYESAKGNHSSGRVLVGYQHDV